MARVSLVAVLVFGIAVCVARGMNCTGDLTSDYHGDVYIANRSTCHIQDGVKVSGSVYMSNGSNLRTSGKVEIAGSFGILGIEAGYLDLRGKLKVEKIDMYNGTERSGIFMSGVTVGLGGLKLEASTGDMVICDSVVHDVLEYKECKGNFVAWKDWWALEGWWGCGDNKFTKDVKIEAIEGDVSIKGTDAEGGELNIKGTVGKLTLEDMDVAMAKIEMNQGPIYMEDVDGVEGELKENIGGVQIYNLEFGKLNCIDNVGVSGYDNEIRIPGGQCRDARLLDLDH